MLWVKCGDIAGKTSKPAKKQDHCVISPQPKEKKWCKCQKSSYIGGLYPHAKFHQNRMVRFRDRLLFGGFSVSVNLIFETRHRGPSPASQHGFVGLKSVTTQWRQRWNSPVGGHWFLFLVPIYVLSLFLETFQVRYFPQFESKTRVYRLPSEKLRKAENASQSGNLFCPVIPPKRCANLRKNGAKVMVNLLFDFCPFL